ncbi:Aste57867_2861 [Aphanomyces stellatus]|uniref:Aste57867_2861 protein n=1 Tax=Aphanomyces stellatus TaxID=120398 RepID=A0A485KCR5_9STRA|nr:hypothetical protein As57867_002853 [Aphanomyces stellatus]VFT80048.1 Aste57867_2861 [Aphanomyces stellatus]
MASPKHGEATAVGVEIVSDEASTVHFSKKAVEYLKKCVLEENLTGLKVDVERRQEIALTLSCSEARVTNWIRNFTQNQKKNDHIPMRPVPSTSSGASTPTAVGKKNSIHPTIRETTSPAAKGSTAYEIFKNTNWASVEEDVRRRLTASSRNDISAEVVREINEQWAQRTNHARHPPLLHAADAARHGMMPPPSEMTEKDRAMWKKQWMSALQTSLDALAELGCPSILMLADEFDKSSTFEPRGIVNAMTRRRIEEWIGAVAVHANEHVRNNYDMELRDLLPDIAVIRRQFPSLYPPPPNPTKRQDKVWKHVLGALNQELQRMGQPGRKQMPWHALVSGTIGIKNRQGATEKRKFDLVNWPDQVPKRKKLDESHCLLLLQNLPAVRVAIADEGGRTTTLVAPATAEETHSDEHDEVGDE